ncbi:hypothetical protein Taro_031375 [Colocasia esculenta]|uniref:Uncharacterized protein n=1 Tax=Colocasia esculenta TaxID=4460 RepID=A0A843W305_COLES|nr:hypothetical protein [Colocasia esculenta]
MGLRPCGPLRPVRGRRTRIKYVIGLTGLVEAFRHSWYQSKKFEMADRRDWGGGGDDPEDNTQRMIERIWEASRIFGQGWINRRRCHHQQYPQLSEGLCLRFPYRHR